MLDAEGNEVQTAADPLDGQKMRYIFESISDAETAAPEDQRYRLYKVVDGAKTLFCWERNPTTAIGRCAKHWGVTAEPHARTMSADDIVSTFQALDPQEKEAILAQLREATGLKESGKAGRKHAAQS